MKKLFSLSCLLYFVLFYGNFVQHVNAEYPKATGVTGLQSLLFFTPQKNNKMIWEESKVNLREKSITRQWSSIGWLLIGTLLNTVSYQRSNKKYTNFDKIYPVLPSPQVTYENDEPEQPDNHKNQLHLLPANTPEENTPDRVLYELSAIASMLTGNAESATENNLRRIRNDRVTIFEANLEDIFQYIPKSKKSPIPPEVISRLLDIIHDYRAYESFRRLSESRHLNVREVNGGEVITADYLRNLITAIAEVQTSLKTAKNDLRHVLLNRHDILVSNLETALLSYYSHNIQKYPAREHPTNKRNKSGTQTRKSVSQNTASQFQKQENKDMVKNNIKKRGDEDENEDRDEGRDKKNQANAVTTQPVCSKCNKELTVKNTCLFRTESVEKLCTQCFKSVFKLHVINAVLDEYARHASEETFQSSAIQSALIGSSAFSVLFSPESLENNKDLDFMFKDSKSAEEFLLKISQIIQHIIYKQSVTDTLVTSSYSPIGKKSNGFDKTPKIGHTGIFFDDNPFLLIDISVVPEWNKLDFTDLTNIKSIPMTKHGETLPYSLQTLSPNGHILLDIECLKMELHELKKEYNIKGIIYTCNTLCAITKHISLIESLNCFDSNDSYSQQLINHTQQLRLLVIAQLKKYKEKLLNDHYVKTGIEPSYLNKKTVQKKSFYSEMLNEKSNNCALLKLTNLFRMHQIPADGNCFYESLAYLLNARPYKGNFLSAYKKLVKSDYAQDEKVTGKMVRELIHQWIVKSMNNDPKAPHSYDPGIEGLVSAPEGMSTREVLEYRLIIDEAENSGDIPHYGWSPLAMIVSLAIGVDVIMLMPDAENTVINAASYSRIDAKSLYPELIDKLDDAGINAPYSYSRPIYIVHAGHDHFFVALPKKKILKNLSDIASLNLFLNKDNPGSDFSIMHQEKKILDTATSTRTPSVNIDITSQNKEIRTINKKEEQDVTGGGSNDKEGAATAPIPKSTLNHEKTDSANLPETEHISEEIKTPKTVLVKESGSKAEMSPPGQPSKKRKGKKKNKTRAAFTDAQADETITQLNSLLTEQKAKLQNSTQLMSETEIHKLAGDIFNLVIAIIGRKIEAPPLSEKKHESGSVTVNQKTAGNMPSRNNERYQIELDSCNQEVVYNALLFLHEKLNDPLAPVILGAMKLKEGSKTLKTDQLEAITYFKSSVVRGNKQGLSLLSGLAHTLDSPEALNAGLWLVKNRSKELDDQFPVFDFKIPVSEDNIFVEIKRYIKRHIIESHQVNLTDLHELNQNMNSNLEQLLTPAVLVDRHILDGYKNKDLGCSVTSNLYQAFIYIILGESVKAYNSFKKSTIAYLALKKRYSITSGIVNSAGLAAIYNFLRLPEKNEFLKDRFEYPQILNSLRFFPDRKIFIYSSLAVGSQELSLNLLFVMLCYMESLYEPSKLTGGAMLPLVFSKFLDDETSNNQPDSYATKSNSEKEALTIGAFRENKENMKKKIRSKQVMRKRNNKLFSTVKLHGMAEFQTRVRTVINQFATDANKIIDEANDLLLTINAFDGSYDKAKEKYDRVEELLDQSIDMLDKRVDFIKSHFKTDKKLFGLTDHRTILANTVIQLFDALYVIQEKSGIKFNPIIADHLYRFYKYGLNDEIYENIKKLNDKDKEHYTNVFHVSYEKLLNLIDPDSFIDSDKSVTELLLSVVLLRKDYIIDSLTDDSVYTLKKLLITVMPHCNQFDEMTDVLSFILEINDLFYGFESLIDDMLVKIYELLLPLDEQHLRELSKRVEEILSKAESYEKKGSLIQTWRNAIDTFVSDSSSIVTPSYSRSIEAWKELLKSEEEAIRKNKEESNKYKRTIKNIAQGTSTHPDNNDNNDNNDKSKDDFVVASVIEEENLHLSTDIKESDSDSVDTKLYKLIEDNDFDKAIAEIKQLLENETDTFRLVKLKELLAEAILEKTLFDSNTTFVKIASLHKKVNRYKTIYQWYYDNFDEDVFFNSPYQKILPKDSEGIRRDELISIMDTISSLISCLKETDNPFMQVYYHQTEVIQLFNILSYDLDDAPHLKDQFNFLNMQRERLFDLIKHLSELASDIPKIVSMIKFLVKKIGIKMSKMGVKKTCDESSKALYSQLYSRSNILEKSLDHIKVLDNYIKNKEKESLAAIELIEQNLDQFSSSENYKH